MSTPGGSSPWGDADAFKVSLEDQVAQAQARAVRARDMQHEIQALRARARSRNGEVEAETDASGALTDLRLNDRAIDMHPQALAQLILETTMQARKSAGEKAVAVATEAFGENSSATSMLRHEVEQREAARHDGLTY
ncbi:YbaB/EbfC family nucleoid-associated protein [Demequina sp.]|uniref:YbaB/EbfC family nucleoid-associated protein n=1 Tax=Demequina sp. TaxID=2050685 RepID=UPI003A83A9AA